MVTLEKGGKSLYYVDALLSIYELEAKKIAGPGSHRRNIQETLWTVDELMEDISKNPLRTVSRLDVENLLKRMKKEGMEKKERELLVVTDANGTEKYTTRTAETIRVMGHAYEYWHKGRPGTESIRWIVEEKKVPNRTIPAQEFIDDVIAEVFKPSKVKKDHPELPRCIKEVIEGISKVLVSDDDWTNAKYSKFQFRSVVIMLKGQYFPNQSKRSQILTANVGAGKTIAFCIPVFVSALESLYNGRTDTRSHLLLYPRTALALDQYEKIKTYGQKIHSDLKIHLEHSSFYREQDLSVKVGVPEIYRDPKNIPHIVISTMETLKRRLRNPFFTLGMGGNIVRIVLDEIHLVQGLTGNHVVKLMRRLRAINKDKFIYFTGSSATVATPDIHTGKVFGIEKTKVAVIAPDDGDLVPYGVVNHVFLKPSLMTSTMGVLVNATSLLVHSRRSNLHKLHQQRKTTRNPKTIGFADNLDILGRWNADFRENERTESSYDRRHPTTNDFDDWSPRQREIPYALRYVNPLSRRIGAIQGKKEGYRPVLKEHENLKICEECHEGKKIAPIYCTQEDLDKLARFVYREPTADDKSVRRFHIRNEAFVGPRDINTLDECPYLQAGACLWFSNDDFNNEEISNSGVFEYSSVARSRIHSSKTKGQSSASDLDEAVFKGSLFEIYDIAKKDGKRLVCDVVFSSPSLEVGVDLKHVTESIMYKAIRNIASYRQKTGRAGREEGADTINTTIISQSTIDYHYYRQPRKLTSIAQLNPIPLEDHNPSILLSALYSAIWDYLAAKKPVILPEIIYAISPGNWPVPDFTTALQKCVEELTINEHEVASYLQKVAGIIIAKDDSRITKAIETARQELVFLGLPIQGLFQAKAITTIADIILNSHAKHPVPLIISTELSRATKDIVDATKSYNEVRPQISPIKLDLVKECQTLDMMSRCGWIKSEITAIKPKIDGIVTSQSGYVERDLRKISRILEDITFAIEVLDAKGINSLAYHFYSQFSKLANDKENSFKIHYLSYILQELDVFRHFRMNLSYVSPANLFSNPYEDDVEIVFRDIFGSNRGKDICVKVPIEEALFSFIPGTWTFRWGVRPYKTHVGKLNHTLTGVFVADLDRMPGDNLFILQKGGLQDPLSNGKSEIDVYQPVRLLALQTNKYQRCRPKTGLVVDNDEESKGGTSRGDTGHTLQIKIPRSFIGRWVDVKDSAGEEILPYIEDDHEFIIDKDNVDRTGRQAISSIKHPLVQELISSVQWHNHLEAIDYVHSITRTYGKPEIGERKLLFTYGASRIAFGRSFTTQGVSIDLNPDTLDEVIAGIIESIKEGNPEWIPTIIKVLSARFLQSNGDDVNPSRFIVRDLIGVLLVSIYPNLEKLKFENIFKYLRDLLDDEDAFDKSAKAYYSSLILQVLEDHNEEEFEHQVQGEEIEERISSLSESCGHFKKVLGEIEKDIDSLITDWLRKTILNSFGDAALRALQKLSGVTGTEVGYTIDLKGLNTPQNGQSNRYRIYLFDRNQYGNGSCRVLRDFYHILHVERYADYDRSKFLPSFDFITHLEEELLQCMQFLQDMNALMMHEQPGKALDNEGYQELLHLSKYSKEVARVSEEIWTNTNIAGVKDGWKLPLINVIAGYVSKKYNLKHDDVVRATGTCWNGCPECVDSRGGVLGSLAGNSYIDKAVLDYWFSKGRENARAYKKTSLVDLKNNAALIEIGALSDLRIDFHRGGQKTLTRSVSLPYTIGFEIDRWNPSLAPFLVIRDNDLYGLDSNPPSHRTSWHGIPTQSFRRLIWHTLLTTAFLDSMNLFNETQKEINLVYFNIRDLDFTDTGLSGRAMDVVEYHRGANITTPIESLSDVLIWLANREFKVTVCTAAVQLDRNKNRHYWRVEQLFRKLSTNPNITLIKKDFPMGIMHKKGLQTPMGFVSGSANLTFSGATKNEEDLQYFLISDLGYADMVRSFKDTMKYGKKWDDA